MHTCYFMCPGFHLEKRVKMKVTQRKGVPGREQPPHKPPWPSSFLQSSVFTGGSEGEVPSASPTAWEELWLVSWCSRNVLRRQSGLAAFFWSCGYNCYLQQYFIFSFWFAVFLSTRFMRNFSFPSPSLHPSIRADFLADSGGAPPMPCHPKWSSIGFLEPVLSYPSSICVDISLSWPLPCPSLLITLWYF